MGVMRRPNAIRFLTEFFGFLLVSTGGTLISIGGLLLLSRVGLGDGDTGSMASWLSLVLGAGVSGMAMVAVGICLVRRLKT